MLACVSVCACVSLSFHRGSHTIPENLHFWDWPLNSWKKKSKKSKKNVWQLFEVASRNFVFNCGNNVLFASQKGQLSQMFSMITAPSAVVLVLRFTHTGTGNLRIYELTFVEQVCLLLCPCACAFGIRFHPIWKKKQKTRKHSFVRCFCTVALVEKKKRFLLNLKTRLWSLLILISFLLKTSFDSRM